MPYIHFTDEQKRQANEVNLAEFLRLKGEPLTRSGRELRMERNHSVTVCGSEWYDHAAEKGGGPVSFLKEFYGMSYQEAVLALLDQDVSQLYPQVDTPKEKEKKEFTLPPANADNRRVFAYLLKHRHLDREVVTAFVRLGLIYEDKGYHNAVFAGKGKDGEAHHAHKRSTNSQGKSFRMTVEGSDFRYAFNWPGSSGHLLVFEAPIDMLSFISAYHWRKSFQYRAGFRHSHYDFPIFDSYGKTYRRDECISRCGYPCYVGGNGNSVFANDEKGTTCPLAGVFSAGAICMLYAVSVFCIARSSCYVRIDSFDETGANNGAADLLID